MKFTITERFLALLNMSEEAFKNCIDMYNHGYMTEESRIALEAIAAFAED